MKQKNRWCTKILLDESLDRDNKDPIYIRNVVEKFGKSKECQRIFYLGLSQRIFGHLYNVALITLFSCIIAMYEYFFNHANGLVVFCAFFLILVLPIIQYLL